MSPPTPADRNEYIEFGGAGEACSLAQRTMAAARDARVVNMGWLNVFRVDLTPAAA